MNRWQSYSDNFDSMAHRFKVCKNIVLWAKQFQDKIRCYNSALSFVSFGANLELPPGTSWHGPPACMLHGVLYHHSYAIETTNGTNPKFAQLYWYDGDWISGLTWTLSYWISSLLWWESVRFLLRSTNKWKSWQINTYNKTGATSSRVFAAATTGDMRRYNHPTKEEVAAVFDAEDGAPPGYRDMVLYVMRVRTIHQHLRGRVSKKTIK